jgi:hypothetical protein
MKIETPAALRYIMQDDIFLLPADKAKPVETIAVVAVKTPDAIFKYLGSNKKNFLILVNYTGHEFIADAHLAALQSILSRKEYNLDDIAILNQANYITIDFAQLATYFNPQKILVLGKAAMPAGIGALQFNEPVQIGNSVALYSFSFDEMMDNIPNKKTFWDKMKNL